MKTIQEVIEDKREEISKIQKEIETLEILLKKYPDLERHVDRWRTERFMSKQINSIADKCYFAHSCGCCNDAPLFVRPYIIDEETGAEIYSNPAQIFIGEKNPYPVPGRVYKPERADPDWEEGLKKHNISQIVIDKTQEYLLANSDLGDDDWDEDNYDDFEPLI